MVGRYIDKNKKLIQIRDTPSGKILLKGKRQLYIIYGPSVSNSSKAKELIASNSFDKLFQEGKKIRTLGHNVSYIKI